MAPARKRQARLFYDLDELGLPYGKACDQVDPPLTFDFKADLVPVKRFWRSIGRVEKVYTGHAAGRITINIREADDVERESCASISARPIAR